MSTLTLDEVKVIHKGNLSPMAIDDTFRPDGDFDDAASHDEFTDDNSNDDQFFDR